MTQIHLKRTKTLPGLVVICLALSTSVTSSPQPAPAPRRRMVGSIKRSGSQSIVSDGKGNSLPKRPHAIPLIMTRQRPKLDIKGTSIHGPKGNRTLTADVHNREKQSRFSSFKAKRMQYRTTPAPKWVTSTVTPYTDTPSEFDLPIHLIPASTTQRKPTSTSSKQPPSPESTTAKKTTNSSPYPFRWGHNLQDKMRSYLQRQKPVEKSTQKQTTSKMQTSTVRIPTESNTNTAVNKPVVTTQDVKRTEREKKKRARIREKELLKEQKQKERLLKKKSRKSKKDRFGSNIAGIEQRSFDASRERNVKAVIEETPPSSEGIVSKQQQKKLRKEYSGMDLSALPVFNAIFKKRKEAQKEQPATTTIAQTTTVQTTTAKPVTISTDPTPTRKPKSDKKSNSSKSRDTEKEAKRDAKRKQRKQDRRKSKKKEKRKSRKKRRRVGRSLEDENEQSVVRDSKIGLESTIIHLHGTQLCADVNPNQKTLTATECTEESWKFEQNTGQLLHETSQKCLSITTNSSKTDSTFPGAVLSACNPDESKQQWLYRNGIVSLADEPTYCLSWNPVVQLITYSLCFINLFSLPTDANKNLIQISGPSMNCAGVTDDHGMGPIMASSDCISDGADGLRWLYTDDTNEIVSHLKGSEQSTQQLSLSLVADLIARDIRVQTKSRTVPTRNEQWDFYPAQQDSVFGQYRSRRFPNKCLGYYLTDQSPELFTIGDCSNNVFL